MISLLSYFEISGKIHQCEADDLQMVQTLNPKTTSTIAELSRGSPGKDELKLGVIAPMAARKGFRVWRTLSRSQRAIRAASLAGGLAAADGPLPAGDLAAIVVLSAFAGYETYRVLDELL
eukprot:SAG11_NODE_3345_length_2508_cov_27.233292_4_plen_120_part_00